jgi:cytochrome c-type biogenesis protein CcmH/NrfF
VKRITLIAILVLCFSLVATARSNDERYNDLGVKIQCVCSCQQALIKCNHVGCQYSDKMIRELRATINNYSDDEDVLNFFRRSYGMTAVVAPNTHGFELTIWILPLVLAAAGIFLLLLISRRWRSRATPIGVVQLDPQLEDLRDRARKETEI